MRRLPPTHFINNLSTSNFPPKGLRLSSIPEGEISAEKVSRTERLKDIILKCTTIVKIALIALVVVGTHNIPAEAQTGLKTQNFENITVLQDRLANLIIQYARIYGVDENLALDIAKIESGLNPRAKNKTSSATGVFQLTKGFRERYCGGFDGLDPIQNVSCALWVMSNRGIDDWLADIHTKNRLIKLGYL